MLDKTCNKAIAKVILLASNVIVYRLHIITFTRAARVPFSCLMFRQIPNSIATQSLDSAAFHTHTHTSFSPNFIYILHE